MFFRVFTHLLPRAKAWRLTAEKTLRNFFEGLIQLPMDIREFYEEIWTDIDPQQSRFLSDWETEFGLPATDLTEQERRDRLEAAWAATGGQSPRYLQDTLQAAGFDVYVHEWWVPGSDPPMARNPFLILDDGLFATKYLTVDGAADMQDGDSLAQDGGTIDPAGYLLVDKRLVPVFTVVDGAADMQDGDAIAQDGANSGEYEQNTHLIPTDQTKWPFVLYIGAASFPGIATLPAERKNEFETLMLKLRPAQQWLGVLVVYT